MHYVRNTVKPLVIGLLTVSPAWKPGAGTMPQPPAAVPVDLSP